MQAHFAIWFLAIATLFASPALGGDTLHGSPEIATLQREFPALAKLLTAEKPWEQEPLNLAKTIFARPPKIAQGSAAYPLLLDDEREEDGWPGETIFGQWSYETEFYAFDLERPVIKLHVGRPLLFSMQHGRVEAVAASRKHAAQFPVLDAKVIPPLLTRLASITNTFRRFGARPLPSDHQRVASYSLPNDIIMTVTDYSGSCNGTPYVEITFTPAEPVRKFTGAQTPAFPGAEGFGRFAVGGRGGKVYVVTSLDDYLPEGRPGREAGTYGQASEHALTLGEGNWEPYVDALGKPHPDQGRPLLPAYPALPPEPVIHGTLREAVEAEGPRYVVFAVSGDINLKSDLDIRNPYITIAGQSAPGDGIQIRNWGVNVQTHDVILRYLRIRVGEIKGPGKIRRVLGDKTHALDLSGINVIADHCEAAYANDQVFNVYGIERRVAATLQWSYVYGAPTHSTHEKGEHSMDMVIAGWSFASFHHNLIAHGRSRNPRVDMLTFDFRDNVIYNFVGTGYGSDNDTRRLNYIGNTLKQGPDTKGAAYAFAGTGPYWQLYGADNQLPPDFKGVFSAPGNAPLPDPIPVAPVTTQHAAAAYRLVLDQGGANKPVRDSITTYVAQTVHDGTGFIPGTADDWPTHGYAKYPRAKAPADKNHNGIPDKWEIAHKLNPATCKATGRDLDPNYDNIEVYLNSLSEHESQ